MTVLTGPPLGTKFDAFKARCDLLPPRALLGAAKVLAYGATKYAPDNWRAVPNARQRYVAAALRHMLAAMAGERLDPESGLPHVDHALCCLLFVSELDATATCVACGRRTAVIGDLCLSCEHARTLLGDVLEDDQEDEPEDGAAVAPPRSDAVVRMARPTIPPADPNAIPWVVRPDAARAAEAST